MRVKRQGPPGASCVGTGPSWTRAFSMASQASLAVAGQRDPFEREVVARTALSTAVGPEHGGQLELANQGAVAPRLIERRTEAAHHVALAGPEQRVGVRAPADRLRVDHRDAVGCAPPVGPGGAIGLPQRRDPGGFRLARPRGIRPSHGVEPSRCEVRPVVADEQVLTSARVVVDAGQASHGRPLEVHPVRPAGFAQQAKP